MSTPPPDTGITRTPAEFLKVTDNPHSTGSAGVLDLDLLKTYFLFSLTSLPSTGNQGKDSVGEAELRGGLQR